MKHLVFVVKSFLQQLENFFSRSPQKSLPTYCKTASHLNSEVRYYESSKNKKQELFSLSTSSWSAFCFLIDRRFATAQKLKQHKTTHNNSPHYLRPPHPKNTPKHAHNALIYRGNLPLLRYPFRGVLRCVWSRKDRNYSKPFGPWQASNPKILHPIAVFRSVITLSTWFDSVSSFLQHFDYF